MAYVLGIAAIALALAQLAISDVREHVCPEADSCYVQLLIETGTME
jgi:hypothetical protein